MKLKPSVHGLVWFLTPILAANQPLRAQAGRVTDTEAKTIPAIVPSPFEVNTDKDRGYPIVVRQTRRPAVAASPSPRGGWNLIALPIGDVDFEMPVLKPE